MMSRPTVMAGFHGHGQAHAGQHYGVPAQSHYTAMVHHSGMPFARPLPMRAPVLAPAGFDHHNHQHQLAGHHQHGRSHNHNLNLNQSHTHAQHLAMANPYMASDEEIAHLQKLSSEYEPEATVGLPCCGSCPIHR
jgi:ubiquitin thioesterase protein OTUB1